MCLCVLPWARHQNRYIDCIACTRELLTFLGNCTKYSININLPKRQRQQQAHRMPRILSYAFHCLLYYFAVAHSIPVGFLFANFSPASVMLKFPFSKISIRKPSYKLNNWKTCDRISCLVVNYKELKYRLEWALPLLLCFLPFPHHYITVIYAVDQFSLVAVSFGLVVDSLTFTSFVVSFTHNTSSSAS